MQTGPAEGAYRESKEPESGLYIHIHAAYNTTVQGIGLIGPVDVPFVSIVINYIAVSKL
jgi:hypothetical protein